MYELLCISSGGIKGFSALGALQYMHDSQRLDIKKINILSGTSIGSGICFFLSIGFTPIEIVVYICSHGVFENFKLKRIPEIFTGDGVYDYDSINEYWKKMTLSKINFIPTLREMKELYGKSLIFCTYNLTEKKSEYLSADNHPDLSCLDAIRMSSNLPFLFSSYKYKENEYIDGAVCDSFPIRVLPYNDMKTLGIIMDDDKVKDGEEKDSMLKIIDKIYTILMIPLEENYKSIMNLVKNEIHSENIDLIELKVKNMNIYRFNISNEEKLEMFSLGYNVAKNHFGKKEEEISTSISSNLDK
jgi:predicted acylesterase/phospholipase RssA